MITTRRIRLFLIAILTTSGVMHFVRPAPFISIVPPPLPRKAELVAISGAAELVCAALLVHPAGRRFGGPMASALFVAVFPANVSMALRSRSGPAWYRVVLWVRLPLQVPLVLGALRVGRSPTALTAATSAEPAQRGQQAGPRCGSAAQVGGGAPASGREARAHRPEGRPLAASPHRPPPVGQRSGHSPAQAT